MSTSLLRVHDELSQIARERMGNEDGIPTERPEAVIPEFDVDAAPVKLTA